MRRVLVAVAMVVLGVAVPTAFAAGLPTVSTPTVTTTALPKPPTLPVTTTVRLPVTTTTVRLPTTTAPAPTTTAPVSTAKATAPVRTTTAPVSTATAPVQTATAPVRVTTPSALPSTTVGSSSSSSVPSSTVTASTRPATSSFAPSVAQGTARSYTAGFSGTRRHAPARHPVVARFRLSRPARVHVSVWEQAPRCRFLGSYSVAATRGRNAVTLRRRVGSHRLGAGSYRFVGSVSGRRVLDVRVRFVRVARSLLAVRHTKVADVCAQQASTVFLAAAAMGVPPNVVTGKAGTRSASAPSTGVPGTPTSATGAPYRPPVQARTPTSATSGGAGSLRFVLLAFALALLAMASVPGRVVADGAVVRHRAAFTVVGFAFLVAAAVLLFA